MTMLETVEESIFDELQGGRRDEATTVLRDPVRERYEARDRHLAAAIAAYVCDKMNDVHDAEDQMRFVREAIERAEGVVALFAEPR
jgi:hypothetical protein